MKSDAAVKGKFGELWLKKGSYDQVLQALRKNGVKATREHLRTLRYRLGLPTERTILAKHARCVKCGKSATGLFNLEKRPEAKVPLSRRCFDRLRSRRLSDRNFIADRFRRKES